MGDGMTRVMYTILSISAGQANQPLDSGLWELHGHDHDRKRAARHEGDVALRPSSAGRCVLLLEHPGCILAWTRRVPVQVCQVTT